MPLERVINELKTHEQVAPSLEQRFNLKELFQREIDRDRVKNQLVDGYLRNPRKLKFFNSITVALLPRSKDGVAQPEFHDYENNDPVVPHDSNDRFDAGFKDLDRTIFGGVQFTKTESGIARLRWDLERVDAVAVDGQHRLMALQRWFDDNKNKSLEEHERATGIPVIFLLLDKKAGFRSVDHNTAVAIKSVAREIFTDLNKNARQVDKATEIILDDRSLTALCVRQLITDQTATDDTEALPLSLVRWRDANHRFDQDYYLNSLMHLHLMLSDVFAIDPPKDPVDADSVRDFIKLLNRNFGLPANNYELRSGTTTLLHHYQDKYLDESGEAVIPFSELPTAFLDCAVIGFKERFRPWILKVLRDFSPYRKVLSYARENNLITGVFALFLSQPSGHRKELERTLEQLHGPGWRSQLLEQHQQAIGALKGKDPHTEEWAFKSIFQKALVKLVKFVEYDNPLSHEIFGRVEDVLAFLGNIYERGGLRVRADLPGHKFKLWTFVALNPMSGNIKVSRNIEANILSLLKIWYLGMRYASRLGKRIVSENPQPEVEISAKDCLSQLYRKNMVSEWPLYDDLSRLEDSWRSRPDLLLTKDLNEIEEKDRSRASHDRLLAVCSAGWTGSSPSPVRQENKPVEI